MRNLLMLIVIAITGCGGGGGDGAAANQYDGTWNLTVSDGLIASLSQTCTNTYTALVISNGSGDSSYTRTCTVNASGAIASQVTTPVAVSISASGTFSAVIGTSQILGSCISVTACSGVNNPAMKSVSIIR